MADPNTPSWLSQNDNAPTQDVLSSGNNDVTSSVTTSKVPTVQESKKSAAAASASAKAAEEDADLPGVILLMRLANLGVAGALIACSIILMLTIPPISAFVLAVYAICGGLLICCLETQLKFLRIMIAVNFGFLFNSMWRFGFYLLLGSVAWSFDNLFGRIVSIAFAAVAVFNTYILCRYPSYRKLREKIAEEEDKRIEARIRSEVKKQAARQVMR